MMKPIDKQVLETMQTLDHPYSNAYWDGALAHIEGREKRRRRIIGFWWILAGVIVISAISILWRNAVEKEGEPLHPTEKQVAVIESDNQSLIIENERTEFDPGKSIAINGFLKAKNSSTERNLNEPPIRNKLKALEKQQNFQGGNIPVREKMISGNGIVTTPSSSERNNRTIALNEDLTIINSNLPGEFADDIAKILTLPSEYLDNELNWEYEKPKLIAAQSVQVTTWHLNILTDLSVLTNVPGRSDEKAILGAQAGIGLRLQSGTGFFTGISAGYAIRTGTFGNMLDHPTPEYVFEKKEEGFRLIPTSLSYMHSQLYAGWEQGRWSGRAGIQGMYLVGATGELFQYSTEVSVENPGEIIPRVSKISGGSISTPAFRNWVFEMQAGLEFAISQRWRITGQFAYTPRGLTYPLVENIYDPIAGVYETTGGESIIKEQNYHIQLGIQYRW